MNARLAEKLKDVLKEVECPDDFGEIETLIRNAKGG